MSHSGVRRESSYQVTLSRSCGAPGTAGGSFAGQHVRQPISGPGRPRECALSGGSAQVGIDLAGDVALQAADDFLLGLSFGCAAFDVGAGGRVRAHAGEHDPPQGVAGLAVTARVEPAADGLTRRCRDRCGAAQVRPGGLAAQPFQVVSGCDEQQCGGAGADPVEGEQPGGVGGDEGADEICGATSQYRPGVILVT